MVVLECWGYPDGRPCSINGCYLVAFDFEAECGRGVGDWTRDIRRARRFADGGEALLFWKTQSKTVPTRDDGKANRPLTAFNIMITEAGP